MGDELLKIYETNSPKETHLIGRALGEGAKPGQVYALDSDLGGGKTVMAQGFAEGLGIKEPVNSPTFTILKSYESGRLCFHHFDVYRIGDIDEMDEIGYEDCFYGDGVSMVEWAVIIEDILPPDVIRIKIERDLEKGADYRKITVMPKG